MAPCIQLHRFIQLQDKERSHVFTFLVENPHEISTFDVRSREFNFAGHRWYVYTGKPNNEYFSFYLRIVNLGKDVRVHTVYSFNVINLINGDNNYIYYSPPEGRIFSRNDDALSWGWKEFIRRETLLKPNGGFLFDGNKALVELECKNFKTVIEETVQLPQLSPSHPFPMVHTSPFSVGGFAWQIRVFPDGPDEENQGNVALFLHATTANHLVRVKARFLIEGQPSPVIYEHTFPPNCISEMPSGVAFPNDSEFMSSLTDNKLRVGVEFMSVTEVNEVHITLTEPTNLPTVCVTPFEDLTGCAWVIKTLQASKLKLKLDQNEKTVTGLMEFYHRQVVWNATLVSPACDDCSMNIELNKKGVLIGYFGDNWSDADVIKSEINIGEMINDDNLYRTDVDDGYERYSYISVHVEILSNHLLYKTPAPSPTGDRERKLLYSARKEKEQIKTKYKELLRQRANLEHKCQHLERERSELLYRSEGRSSTTETITPDYTRLLFDMMAELSRRAGFKNMLQDEGKSVKQYQPPIKKPEKELQNAFAVYRSNFDMLVNDSSLDDDNVKTLVERVESFSIDLKDYLQSKTGLRITKTVIGGSIGTGTCTCNRFDADIYMSSPDIPYNGHSTWLPSFIVAIMTSLKSGCEEEILKDLSAFYCNDYSIQMMLGDEIEVDLYVSYDWTHQPESDGSSPAGFGYEVMYDELLRQRTSDNLCWFASDAAELQVKFINEQCDEVKDVIKIVKQWRDSCDWKQTKWKPPSYLISLLVIRCHDSMMTHNSSSSNIRRSLLKNFVKLVLATSAGNKSSSSVVKLSWSRFYDTNDFNIEYSSNEDSDCPPIVQDPANPANNVAERPVSWIPFRKKLEKWAQNLQLIKERPQMSSASIDINRVSVRNK